MTHKYGLGPVTIHKVHLSWCVFTPQTPEMTVSGGMLAGLAGMSAK